MQPDNIFAFELCSFVEDTFEKADSSKDTKKASIF